MKYRKFGSLDCEVSVLGFGVSGLPSRCEEPGGTTEAESMHMIRYAIDHGVNYLDLGYPCDMARQESVTKVVERALRNGYREKVKISVTVPVWIAGTGPEDAQLARNRLGRHAATPAHDCVAASPVLRLVVHVLT